MITLILIIVAIGAYYFLKKRLMEQTPQYEGVKIGATLGVPIFYIFYVLSETSRLWGGGDKVFNRTGYQHLMSGTDPKWDADVFAGVFNAWDSAHKTEWAFMSMADDVARFVAIAVVAMGAIMIYKVFNRLAFPSLKLQTLVIVSAIAAVIPYILQSMALQNGVLWVVCLIVVGVFTWTIWLYKQATARLDSIEVTDLPLTTAFENETLDRETTKTCPYCGETILLIAKKCKHCGEWLPEQEDKEPAEVLYVECPICGEDIDAKATVCPYCNEVVPEGLEVKSRKSDCVETPVNRIQQNVEHLSAGESGNNTKKYLWIAIAVAVLAIIIWYFMTPSSSNNASWDSGYEESSAPSWSNDDDFIIE